MAKRKEITAERFLKDVGSHEMTIHLDQGLYRHLRFQKPDRHWHLRFDVVTWPGFLAITGDVGAYTFSRLTDMFEFFRDTSSPRLSVNLGYWGEKVMAADRNGPLDEYSPALFRDAVKRATWLARRERVKQTAKNGNGMGTPLSIAAKLWPTPTVHGNDNRAGLSPKSGDGLGTAARRIASPSSAVEPESTGKPTRPTTLNPEWVEWLMGVPIGWTDCESSATESSPRSPNSGASASSSIIERPAEGDES